MDFAFGKQSSEKSSQAVADLELLDPRSQAALAQSAELAPALKANGGGEAGANAASIAQAGTQSGGQEIPHRAEMEASFGADFSNVQAHFGESAQRSSQALGAKAYAMGNHVAFADANPSKELVAHELTHVVQQANGPQRKATDGAVDTAGEAQAEAVEAAVANGQSARSVLGDAVQGLAIAPALKTDPDAKGLQINQMLSKDSFTLGKSLPLWEAETPMGALGPVFFYGVAAVSAILNHQINWSEPGYTGTLGIEGEAGIQANLGPNIKVAQVYCEGIGEAAGALNVTVQKQQGFSADLSLSFSGRLSAGIYLLEVLNKRYDLINEGIGSFVGVRWDQNGLTGGKWVWSDAIQSYIDWVERQIEMAKAAKQIAGASAVVLLRAAELYEQAHGVIDNPYQMFDQLWKALPDNPVNDVDDAGWFDWVQMPSWPTLPTPDVGDLLSKLIRLGGNNFPKFW